MTTVSYTHLDVYKRQVLEGRVLSHVQRVTDYILRHEDYFRKVMEEQLRVCLLYTSQQLYHPSVSDHPAHRGHEPADAQFQSGSGRPARGAGPQDEERCV